MRITTRISGGGARSYTRIPLPAKTLKDCLGADDRIDRVKAQLAFSGTTDTGDCPFMAESSDDETVYFAALTFLELLNDAYGKVCDTPDANCARGAETKQDELNQRKMNRGKVVFVRNDVRRSAEGVRVRVSVGNPKGIVGDAEPEARMFAAVCVQLWLRMAEQVKWLTVTADAETMRDATESNKRAEAKRENERRLFCERRTAGGFCSPICPSCKHYKNGMCVEIK